MDIQNFKIIDYEVGAGVNFEQMPSKKGSGFWKSKTHRAYIHIPDVIPN
jgi:hypothetical protein